MVLMKIEKADEPTEISFLGVQGISTHADGGMEGCGEDGSIGNGGCACG